MSSIEVLVFSNLSSVNSNEGLSGYGAQFGAKSSAGGAVSGGKNTPSASQGRA